MGLVLLMSRKVDLTEEDPMKKLILFLAAVGFVTPVYSDTSCNSMSGVPLTATTSAKPADSKPGSGTSTSVR